MRFNEFISEQELDEGPIGQAVGKGVGAAARGLGAVAGGVRGAWDAAKQGFQAGRDTVAGEPAQGTATGTTAVPSATDINAQGPAGTAPAKTQTGAAGAALQKAVQATANATADQAGQTVYAQVKSQIDKLDKRGKQRILQLLQKSLTEPAAPAQAAPATTPAPAAPNFTDSQGGTFNINTGRPLASQAEVDAQNAWFASQGTAAPAQTGQALNLPPGAEQPAPAATTAPATTAQTGRAQGGGKVAGQLSQTPGAVKKRQARAAAKTAPAVQTAGIIRTGNNLSESLSEKIEQHKRKMFESSLSTGHTSIYKK